MGHKWIIDVLADLQAFADMNGLPDLASKLEETARVASVEIAQMAEGTPRAAQGDGTANRILSGTAGESPRT